MSLASSALATVGGVASSVLVRLPLSWRMAIMKGGNITLTQLMKTQAFKDFYTAQNVEHSQEQEAIKADDRLMGIPDGEGQEVTLFFSGGADSTYCAYLLAQEFDRVHLLVFGHDGISNTHKPKTNADRLSELFPGRIVYHVIDGNDVWHRLFTQDFDQDRKKYGAFLNSGACECCFLSWNAIAVVYNRRNNITNLAAGIDVDHSGFMYSAQQGGIEAIKRFYEEYGIHFFLPVFYEQSPDVKLYELGITKQKHTKRPHGFYTNHPTQAICELGLGHRLFAQYTVVREPLEERQTRSEEYFSDKMDIVREYIAEALDNDLPISFVQ